MELPPTLNEGICSLDNKLVCITTFITDSDTQGHPKDDITDKHGTYAIIQCLKFNDLEDKFLRRSQWVQGAQVIIMSHLLHENKSQVLIIQMVDMQMEQAKSYELIQGLVPRAG